MSESKPGARPSQVTMAGWVAAIGSGLLVLTLFDSMAQVRSIEVREAVTEFLSTPPGSGLGLEVPQVVEILRVLTLFSGAAAAAALVLAIYVLQGNNAARIGFTVAAAVIMVTSPVAGGVLPFLIAFAAVMLWTRPARDWFAGRAPVGVDGGRRGATLFSHQPPEDRSRGGAADPGSEPGPDPAPGPPVPPPGRPASGQYGQPPAHGDAGQPPPGQYGQPAHDQYGQPPQGQYGEPPSGQYGPPPGQYAQYPYGQYPYGYPAPYGGPYGQPGYGGPVYASAGAKRPTSVTVAAWLTWVFAGITAAAYLVLVLLLLTARDRFLEQLRAQPQLDELQMGTDDLLAALWVMSAVFIFWCLAAIVLAVLAYRRVGWARLTLALSAGIAALLSAFGIPVTLLHTLAAGAAAVLLFVGGANQWYARRGYPGYPGYPGGSPGHGEPPREQDPPSNVW